METIQRSGGKPSALQFERGEKTPSESENSFAPAAQKRNLLQKAHHWGREFFSRISKRERADKTRHQKMSFEALHQKLQEFVFEQSFR